VLEINDDEYNCEDYLSGKMEIYLTNNLYLPMVDEINIIVHNIAAVDILRTLAIK
jgi:hypothetical protein